MKILGKSFDTSKQYAVFTALSGASPSQAVHTNYLYYLSEPIESHTTMQVVQQGTAANSIAFASMWLMEESANGAYTTLDGRKWNKVYEYTF